MKSTSPTPLTHASLIYETVADLVADGRNELWIKDLYCYAAMWIRVLENAINI